MGLGTLRDLAICAVDILLGLAKALLRGGFFLLLWRGRVVT